jgi:hypothetical protein
MAATTYLYARADWTYSVGEEIPYADSTPFDVSGLIFGTNAFNSAEFVNLWNFPANSNLYFSTCAAQASYGDFVTHVNFTFSTVKLDNFKTANFGKFLLQYGSPTVTFDSAFAVFSSSDENVFDTGWGSKVYVVNDSIITVSGKLDVANQSFLYIEDGAQFNTLGETEIGGTIEISGEGTSFTTNSLVDDEGASKVRVLDGAAFISNGETDIDGTLEISGEGTSFTTGSLVVNTSGATVSISDGAAFISNGETDIDGTLEISGEGTSFTTGSLVVDTVGATVSVSDGAAFEATGEGFVPSAEHPAVVFLESGSTISIEENSTFSADSIYIHESTVEMDSSSLIVAGEIGAAQGGKITVTGSSSSFGCERIISLSGSSASAVPVEIAEGLHLYTTKTADGGYEYWVSSAETVFVNADWNYSQGAPIPGEEGKTYGVNAFNDVNPAAGIAAGSSANLVIEKGTFNDIIELQGVNTTVQKGVGDIKFTKAVCGGTRAVATSGSVSASNVITIEDGTFEKFIVGGSNIHLGNSSDNYALTGVNVDPETERAFAHMLKISGGIFGSSTTGIVAAGDRFERGQFTVNGDINTYISGGTFNYRLAGGLLNSTGSVTDGDGMATVNGNVNLTISGGTFAAGSWIYGGCISSKKENSISARTIIGGNVTVTVDSTENKIRLGNLVVGSHGWGKITGNAKLVLTGAGANLTFNDNTEIWGSCSGDDIDPISGKVEGSSVTGKRTLSFTGFNGKLQCNKIRGFNDFECSGSAVSLKDGGTYSFSCVENWEFTYGKKTDETQADFTGNFENDFTGDTLNLYLGDWDGSNSWTILENAGDDAYTGFGANTFSVNYAKDSGDPLTAMSWDSQNGYYYSAGTGYEYRLGLNGTRMEFTKVSTSTIA